MATSDVLAREFTETEFLPAADCNESQSVPTLCHRRRSCPSHACAATSSNRLTESAWKSAIGRSKLPGGIYPHLRFLTSDQEDRQAWRETITQIGPEQLVFLDENGQYADDSQLWPRSAWRTGAGRYTQPPLTIESPTDGGVFLAYLEQVRCPQFHPGQVVIMDNLSAHTVAGVEQLIPATGARLIYLPPFSQTSTRLNRPGRRSSSGCALQRPTL